MSQNIFSSCCRSRYARIRPTIGPAPDLFSAALPVLSASPNFDAALADASAAIIAEHGLPMAASLRQQVRLQRPSHPRRRRCMVGGGSQSRILPGGASYYPRPLPPQFLIRCMSGKEQPYTSSARLPPLLQSYRWLATCDAREPESTSPLRRPRRL